ncbi:MAG: hypothetical protein ABH862_05095 [Candidatus Omnitrophota bacterium]
MYQDRKKTVYVKCLITAIAVSFVMLIRCVPVFAGTYDPEKKRDPFVPLLGAGKEASSLGDGVLSINDIALQGIVMGADGTYSAIINGEVMKAGDKTEQIEIRSITGNTVVIKIGEESYEVQLYE